MNTCFYIGITCRDRIDPPPAFRVVPGFVPPELGAVAPPLAPLKLSMTPTRGPPPKRWLKFSSRFFNSSLKNFISSYVRRT